MELESILGIEQLRYLAEDETRIGRKTETKRVITSLGVKPKAKVQWPREAFWVYGVVEPLTGWQWTQEYSQLKARKISGISQRPFSPVRRNSRGDATRQSTG